MTFGLTSWSAVGRIQVVPLKEVTLSELKQHDGTNPDKPMYIAIRGTVFDVTTGKHALWLHTLPVRQSNSCWATPACTDLQHHYYPSLIV